MKDFSVFEDSVGVSFKDKDLLAQAFVHRSYINEHSNLKLKHNERLEFLGDAVLELVATKELFTKFPDRDEGDLTAIRAALVNTVSLGDVADAIGMNEYLLLSKGESKDGGKARVHILANTFEAFVGALFMDQGIKASEKFIADVLFPRIEEIVSQKLYQDSKSLVQEKAQDIYSMTPRYEILEEKGPDHDKHFTAGIYFGEDLIEKGKGKSKQEAEQAAARAALEKKNWLS